MWALVEYEGRLAVALPWSPTDEPIESRSLWVHPTEKAKEYLERYSQPKLVSNGHFRVFDRNTYQHSNLFTEHWEHVEESRPIKKPGRGGKTWKWVWSAWGRKWTKRNRPLCKDCGDILREKDEQRGYCPECWEYLK